MTLGGIMDKVEEALLRKQPLFAHDCERCRFVGHYATTSGKPSFPDHPDPRVNGIAWYDLYACDAFGAGNLVARYGNDGSDYTSGLCFVGVSEPITAAYKAAETFGYIQVSFEE